MGHYSTTLMYSYSDQVGQEAILGMDVVVPDGIRLNLADVTVCLPEELEI